ESPPLRGALPAPWLPCITVKGLSFCRCRNPQNREALGRAGGPYEPGPNLTRPHTSSRRAVKVRDADGNSTRTLIWPVLRRGRIILAGLPGSGKSSALVRLAAQLTEVDGRLPLLASLRDIEALPSTKSF